MECKYLEVDRDDQLWKYDEAAKTLENRAENNWGHMFWKYEWNIENTEEECFIRADFDGEFGAIVDLTFSKAQDT